MGIDLSSFLFQKAEKKNTYDDHEGGQNLAHGERAEDKSELDIRFSEELQEKTESAIKGEKDRQEPAGGEFLIFHEPEDEKKDAPFQGTLIELRRMAGQGAPLWKDHPPRDLGHSPVELSVDEIADSSQTQADRSGDDKKVGSPPE